MQGHQDKWGMVESSDKMWSTGERKGKLLQYSCLEDPMNNMKRQKDMKLEDQPPRSINVQMLLGKNREIAPQRMESKPKQK